MKQERSEPLPSPESLAHIYYSVTCNLGVGHMSMALTSLMSHNNH